MALPQTDPALETLLGRPKPSFWARHGRAIGAGVGVLLLLLLLSRCFAGKPPPAYQTATVERGDLAVSVTAVGSLAPTNQITVGSQISGLINKVLVDVNDRVGAGQPVALIDTRRLDDTVRGSQAQLALQLANVEQQKATVAESQAQLERYREVSRLSGGRVPSKTEMAAAEATAARARGALRAAEAQVASAQANLSSDRTQREYAVIRSPVAGVVLSRQVDPGQTVAASFSTPTLFTIAEDLSQMKLDVAIDEADVGQVKAGQAATFTVDAFPGRAFPARIKRVNLGATNSAGSSSSSSNVVSYTATLTVANRDLTLRPGMTATATIAVQTAHDMLLVPNAALRFSPDGAGPAKKATISLMPPTGRSPRRPQERSIGVGSQQTVYVLAPSGKPRPVTVVTGVSDGRYTAVRSGALSPGAVVIVGRKAAPR